MNNLINNKIKYLLLAMLAITAPSKMLWAPVFKEFIAAVMEDKAKKVSNFLNRVKKHHGENLVSFLVNYRVNVEDEEEAIWSPLIFEAVAKGKFNAALVLLDFGADAKLTDDYGNTLLHMMAVAYFAISVFQAMTEKSLINEEAAEKLVDRLVKAGVDIDVQNTKGNTPLHVAINSYATSLVKILVQRGASLDAPNRDGLTSLALANKYTQSLLANKYAQYSADSPAIHIFRFCKKEIVLIMSLLGPDKLAKLEPVKSNIEDCFEPQDSNFKDDDLQAACCVT